MNTPQTFGNVTQAFQPVFEPVHRLESLCHFLGTRWFLIKSKFRALCWLGLLACLCAATPARAQTPVAANFSSGGGIGGEQDIYLYNNVSLIGTGSLYSWQMNYAIVTAAGPTSTGTIATPHGSITFPYGPDYTYYCSYTPTAGYVGTDSFTWCVTNPNTQASSTATLSPGRRPRIAAAPAA